MSQDKQSAIEAAAMHVGNYVLATKHEDGDTGDHYVIGFFDSMLPKLGGDRYMIVDGEGKQFRGNGFRRAEKITAEEGAWLMTPGRWPLPMSTWSYDEEGNGTIEGSVWDWLDRARAALLERAQGESS